MSGPCNRVFKKCSYFKSAIIFFSIGSTDPFKEQVEDASAGGKDSLIHIRIQQRNGRKTLTTVQGLSSDYDLKKIVKVCKKVLYILYRDFIAILGKGLQGSQSPELGAEIFPIPWAPFPKRCLRALVFQVGTISMLNPLIVKFVIVNN